MKRVIAASVLAIVSGAAMASDLPSKKTAPAPAPVTYAPPAFTWTGAYVGLNGGINATNFGPNFGSGWGAMIGGTVGANLQFGQMVVGAEGDFDWTNAAVQGSRAAFATKGRMSSAMTLRARAGYAMDRTLFFVTGGYSGAQIKETAFSLPASESHWRNGLALGAGVEYAITNNITAKVEDIYTWYGKQTYFAGTAEQNANSQRANMIRVGVNYKF